MATKASTKAAPKAADTDKESARDAARRAKEESAKAARQQAIESGDLIVTRNHEFQVTDKVPTSAAIIAKVIDSYKKSDVPCVFNDVALKAGAKYPEDLIASMYSLERVGLVKRFSARSAKGDDRRPRVAFQWVGEK